MNKTSRLSMLGEFGERRQIIPAEVRGKFRRWRTQVHFVLLIIFLALPWIYIDGTQAVLLDIGNRKFEIFGQVFMSHDSPILFFLFALFAVGLMLVTALWGRVWCGWACPQTVFIDAVFRRIEIWTEGKYMERRRLAEAPMSFAKARKLGLKWVLFFIVSSLISHSFIAYFTGSKHLIEMIKASPEGNWTYFLIVTGVTALTLFNFGWFREQFCIIMCPYGRFQNVLMDKHSLSVTYDEMRGEPRKGVVLPEKNRGDCVSCNRCVEVCPTGIDIRNGLQMECIGCTACIDACDDIMAKVKKPLGLIYYGVNSPQTKTRYRRARVLAYMALLAVFSFGLTYSLATRLPYSIILLRAKDAPYQVSPEGEIMNHFRIHLLNQSHRKQNFAIALPGAISEMGVKLIMAQGAHNLAPGESKEIHVFVSVPRNAFGRNGQLPLSIDVNETFSNERRSLELLGLGPAL